MIQRMKEEQLQYVQCNWWISYKILLYYKEKNEKIKNKYIACLLRVEHKSFSFMEEGRGELESAHVCESGSLYQYFSVLLVLLMVPE